MPSPIVVDLCAWEQTCLREQMRRLRLLCPLLRLHIVLLLAQHRSPTEIADWLLCSRSSVYEVAACWRGGWRPEPLQNSGKIGSGMVLAPSLRRSLLALLRKPPTAYGWCRTRWSCAALAFSLETQRGLRVSAETIRRWLHGPDWRWKRTKLTTKDNDQERAPKLVRIRLAIEALRPRQALLFADELDIHLLPKSGYQWMPQGTQAEVLTPGKNAKYYLAGAWDFRTARVHYRTGPRKTNALFRDLLEAPETCYPARRYDRILVVVVDNCCICQSQLKNPHFVAVEISPPVATTLPHLVSPLLVASSAVVGEGAAAVFASSPALRFSFRR